jgi:PAS domain S-box-containing protein
MTRPIFERGVHGASSPLLSERRTRDLETVLESIPDAVLIGDTRGVRQANRAALDLFGVDSVGQLNRPATTLSEILDARRVDSGEPLAPDQRPFAAALRGQAGTHEILVRHLRTGQDVILRCAVAPVQSDDTLVGAVAICADITSRKRRDEERERLYRDAQRASADRQHVLAIVSHDLKNPLNALGLAAELLRDEHVPPALKTDALAVIRRSIDRMSRMVSDLLDANSIEAGRLSVNLLPEDPVSVVEDVVELFSAQAGSCSVALETEVPAPPPLIRGDRHRLVQALSNLVSNALKVTSQGSVTIRLEGRGREVVFGVIDTGPGIPEAERPRLFEPYWRSDNSTYKGTGLGLAIVRGIVEAHGGRVWVETPPKTGAAIFFSVPAASESRA